MKKKPSYAGIKFYNFLPAELKSITEFKKFKEKLKLFMVVRPLYSLNEFFIA